MKKALILAAALAATVPAFAFNATQTQFQINQEVRERYAKGETLQQIADTAKSLGVGLNGMAIALSFVGDASAVVGVMVTVGYDAGAVVNTMVAMGGNRESLVLTAINNGADPAKVTAATAAGNNPAGNAPAGNSPGGNQTAGNTGNTGGFSSFQGFAGNSIRSVSSSVGSGNSVSRN